MCAPLSARITSALSRCSTRSGTLGLWEATLVRSIESYHSARRQEEQIEEQGAAFVAKELSAFYRSLSRTASERATASHWNGLSAEGRTFVEMRLRLTYRSRGGVAELDLTDPMDLAALRDAVGAARRWIGEKPGTEHGAPIRMLVREVSLVYRQATGKRPGLSSSESSAGPSYMTPFEELLLAVLAEAGAPLRLEAARSLYRSELRGKPKKTAS